MSYTPHFFTPKELVSPEIYELLGDASIEVIPQTILMMLDKLRSDFGESLYINADGRMYSGVRPINCSVGAKKSRHKPIYEGVQAFDLHAKKSTNKELWEFCLKNAEKYNICRMENISATPTWVHIEIQESPVSSCYVFNP